jgi:hypothetical protein
VVQPALAVVWSFLLLGETLRGGQVLGITISLCGLVAFLVLHERGARTRRATRAPTAAGPAPRPAGTNADSVGPEEPRTITPRPV